jgi:hypothetical protein
MSSSPAGPDSHEGPSDEAPLWLLRFPGAGAAATLRALRVLLVRAPPRLSPTSRPRAPPRAGAAASAVLAALPSTVRPYLRLSCRAGRAAVDAHARRLEVGQDDPPISAAAAARMPLLREVDLSADDDARAHALAGSLRALARGPASVSNATVWARGGGAALGGVVSALTGLTALTRLELRVTLEEPPGLLGCWSDPPPLLVLPWAHIEVGAAAARWEGLPAMGCVLVPRLWLLSSGAAV